MRQERRRAPRLRVNLKTYIESGVDRREAVILDLSLRGCFVLTSRELSEGSLVKVEVGKPGVLHMTMDGVVVRYVRARGAGVRFTGLTVTKQSMLTKLLQNLSRQGTE